MEEHMPLSRVHCEFVAETAQKLSDHLSQHNQLPSCAEDSETAPTTASAIGSHQTRVSSRLKRKLKSRPASSSSSPGDGDKEQPEKDGRDTKRRRKAVNRDKDAALDTAVLKSKEYVAEAAEHIYRTHTCPTCRRCFKMRSHLQEHLHIHFPDPSLQCPTCKRYFTSKSKLRIHRLREAGEKVHRCHLCDYSAVEQNAVRRHLISMHADAAQGGVNGPSYPCPTCGQSFRQSRSLKTHMKMHNIPTTSQPVACFQEACSFQTSSPKELLRHTLEVHGVQAVQCRHHACGAVFEKETDMEAHYRTHLAYHCSQCDFSCSNKALFLQHQRQGHAGTDKLCCDFCSFETFNPVEFEQHIGHLHANEKIHRCSQCSYVTSHKRGLKRHVLMHSGERPHKCSLCDFRCRDESYLSRHMLTHSDDKNFMCAECGYVTKWKHYLNVHMRKHAGDLRYQCDQCSYRCHRMDQLNSHKLRHQAKTLMCEICAYACKRKYELRNHMLAKHSGEERPPSVHQCKYCAYTTCYRQALQNHENCKHTKLKEFHCALCAYSSFSIISLFLHKRKSHGYVPGDKAWLEHYAAKEKERNSADFVEDFYNNHATDHEQPGQSSEGEPASQREQLRPAGAAGHSRQTAPAVQSMEAVNALNVPQEVVHEGISDSLPSVNSPEEYCTLILTTLSTTDCQNPSLQNVEEDRASQSQMTATSKTSLEKADCSTSTTSSEEDNVATSHEECELNDLDDSCEPANDSASQSVEHRKCQIPEVASDGKTVGSILPEAQNRPLESEVRLNAMKKHDKDQADAMVLEGRVQMLVVSTKDVKGCEKRSDKTTEETAFRGQAVRTGKTQEHKCQACGAHFKQRRGLDSHCAKKCPALPRKTRTFVGFSKICPAAEESCNQGKQALKELPEGTDTDRTELSSQIQSSTDSIDPDEVCTSHLTVSERSDDAPSGPQQSKSCVNYGKNLLHHNKDRGVSLEKGALYTKRDNKFKCNLCPFASVRLAIVERHLTTCPNRNQRGDNRIPSEVDGDSENESDPAKEVNENNALDGYEKSSCTKAGEVQCTACAFASKSSTTLTRHVLRVHKKKFAVAQPKRLRCHQCSFTCKQERCMAQHVALKHKGVRPHRCRYCPFATTRRYRLEEHESLHTGVGRHECDVCDKTFGAVTKLRQHKMRIHDKQPVHSCPLCDFSGFTLDDIRRHQLRCHTGELKHACTDCDACFSSEIALRNHCKRVHQLQGCFPCKQCDHTCGSEDALKAHQQSKHRELKCTTCQETFLTRQHLELHQRSHLAHRCQLCSFATKTRQRLALHLVGEHEDGPPEDKPLKCSTCSFACRHQLVLEHHLRSHGGRRLYKCRDCDYSTRNKQKITWHIRTHTGEKPYRCEQCSYTCTDPSRLKLHMRVHQEERKYLCPECGYKCKWASQLKYHMTKHTGEKPYACDDCDYRTNRADALRAHRDTQHCDVRPYVCEKCGKAFKTSFILKTHQRQHSDGRPYACGLCHKAFRWPAGLRHHFLSHTKQQPFGCRHCSYRAKQKFQVAKHLQRHHPEESVEQGVVRHAEAVSLTLKEALQGTLHERAADVDKEGEASEGAAEETRQ
ncbi:zinc finger protein 142 [Solea solea]|uniref:zinc finger protein 142 n=1 Tax=Solea solea TaxID=90069 RepID=UPI00272A9E0A|nr:zinc finger protein 142 [Solea solea]